MSLTTLTRTELEDMRDQAQADFQHAKRMRDTYGMQMATSDMSAIDIELVSSNNITITRHELSI